MTMPYITTCAMLISVVLALQALPCASQETVLRLGPELTRRAGSETLPVRVSEGCRPAALEDHSGLWMAAEGTSLSTEIPPDVWSADQGTVMFWLRPSQRIGHVTRGEIPFGVALVSSPGFRLQLEQHADCPWLVAYPDPDSNRPRAVCRIAYLLPDRWYHVAVTWDSRRGAADVLINGWAQQRIGLEPWEVPQTEGATPMQFGVVTTRPDNGPAIALAEPRLLAWPVSEPQLRTMLADEPLCEVDWGVRKRRTEPLDLTGYSLEPVYRADFSQPLPIVEEDALFDGEERVRTPEPGQWVLEGHAEVNTQNGTLSIDNLDTDLRNHVVLWLPQVFPENMMLDFEFMPEIPDRGLGIVFFAARPVGDPQGSIFAPGLARRNGDFRHYIRGDINSYHVSYVSAGQMTSTIPGPRRTANIRKNSGFWLVACGDDQIYGAGYDRRWHRVRILKVGGQIRIEANDRLSAAVDDDGETWGPVWSDGYIGLRQMNHLLSGRYRNLTVYRVQQNR